jgi:hypothetical protein
MLVHIKDDLGQVIGVITTTPKTFKTGSRGEYGNGKVSVNGKRYQTSVMLVEIGSKPLSKPKGK